MKDSRSESSFLVFKSYGPNHWTLRKHSDSMKEPESRVFNVPDGTFPSTWHSSKEKGGG